MELNLSRLCGPLAVVGLCATSGRPPLIYEISVAHMMNGTVSGNTWTYYVQPDTRDADLPDRARPLVSKAPPWSEVADWVSLAIGERPVVIYDPTAYRVLRHHFPDRPTSGVFHAWDIGRKVWPARYGDVPNSGGPSTAQVDGMCGLITAVLVHANVIPVPDLPAQENHPPHT
jgi:hypothetical protein